MESGGDLAMLRLFKNKLNYDHINNLYKIPIRPSIYNYKDENNSVYDTSTQTINNLDSKMNRLMELIGIAIETWAKENHMEKLPKKILFEQALDAMRSIELAMNSREY